MSDVAYFQQKVMEAQAEIGKGLIGQTEIVRQTLLAMLSGGNVLLEGMPGLGKTHLVRTISKVFDLPFKRIQFTPDLMPGDVTGTKIIVKKGEETGFRFEPGPIFSSLVLADEINRATPKTQSALLEAMQEHTVTVGTDTYKMPEPFMVLATQNPIEQEGTYPLPEAQLDRFMFKILVGFPTKEELKGILNLTEGSVMEEPKTVMTAEELMETKALINQIPIADPVIDFILNLVAATHEKGGYIREGASPRAAQALVRAAKAKAFMEGRINASFDDVAYAAYPVLRHRIILNFDAISEGVTEDQVVAGIIAKITK
ncbi:MAG: MoxR family ATPase [Lachnospiraceae bacterium]|nr:MoxR family ATPase [Lachnospiraceae bacterium]